VEDAARPACCPGRTGSADGRAAPSARRARSGDPAGDRRDCAPAGQPAGRDARVLRAPGSARGTSRGARTMPAPPR